MSDADDAAIRHPSVLEPGGANRRRRRGRWIAVGAVGAGVALATTLFSFGLGRNPTLLDSALVGHTAPAFDLPMLSGPGRLDLARFRGQVVVVNFWASWCAECRLEHPALAAAWDRYRDQGVVFVGIPFQDTRSASLSYARQMGGDWPLASDPSGQTALAFGVYGVPETFFVGRDGTVRSRHVGPVTYTFLTDQINALLAGRAR